MKTLKNRINSYKKYLEDNEKFVESSGGIESLKEQHEKRLEYLKSNKKQLSKKKGLKGDLKMEINRQPIVPPPQQRIKEIDTLIRFLNADEQIKQLGETEKLLKESIEKGWGNKAFEEKKLQVIYKRAIDLGAEKHRLEEEKKKLIKEMSIPPKPILEYEE